MQNLTDLLICIGWVIDIETNQVVTIAENKKQQSWIHIRAKSNAVVVVHELRKKCQISACYN